MSWQDTDFDKNDGCAGRGASPVPADPMTCRARASGRARTFSQGEPPSLETVCSAELTGGMGTSQSWAGCQDRLKGKGAGREPVQLAASLGPSWAIRAPLPSPGTMERLHVLSCCFELALNKHLLRAMLCTHFYVLEFIESPQCSLRNVC